MKPKTKVQVGTFEAPEGVYLEVTENGPYVVHGIDDMSIQTITLNSRGISVSYTQGKSFEIKEGTSLCRCGLSKNKPYCDGSHLHAAEYGVDLEETATFDPELQSSQLFEGPVISLTDDEKFCAYARFCDNGERIWNEVQESGKAEQDLTIQMAHHCPGGRLIVWSNETQKPIETQQKPSVGLVEDSGMQCSGPYKIDGGVPIKSASGEFYEVRNRQALCRCGQSSNKPFCDGTHASMKFQDGLT